MVTNVFECRKPVDLIIMVTCRIGRRSIRSQVLPSITLNVCDIGGRHVWSMCITILIGWKEVWECAVFSVLVSAGLWKDSFSESDSSWSDNARLFNIVARVEYSTLGSCNLWLLMKDFIHTKDLLYNLFDSHCRHSTIFIWYYILIRSTLVGRGNLTLIVI